MAVRTVGGVSVAGFLPGLGSGGRTHSFDNLISPTAAAAAGAAGGAAARGGAGDGRIGGGDVWAEAGG